MRRHYAHFVNDASHVSNADDAIDAEAIESAELLRD